MPFTEVEYNSFGPLTRLYDHQGAQTFDFTILFEDAILVTGPLLLGSLLVFLEIVCKARPGLQRTTKPLASCNGWVKLVLYTIFNGLCIAFAAQLAVYGTQKTIYYSSWSTAVVVLTIVAAILITCDNALHHVYFLKPSSPAQLLLGWWIISDVVTTRSRWLLADDNRNLATIQIVLMIAKLAVIVAEEWSKKSILLPSQADATPESLAGIHNRMLLAWLNPLMWRSLYRTVKAEELWPVDEQFRSKAVKRQATNNTTSLFVDLLKEHWWYWLAPLPTRFAQAGFSFAQPFLIYQTLYWLFLPSDDSQIIGYGILGAYACIYIGIAITTAFGQYQVVRLLARIRASLISRIYSRALSMNVTETRDLKALTLMSTNVDKVVEGFMVFQEVVVSVIVLAFGLWLLQRQIGLGAIGPVIIVGVLAITVSICAPNMAKAQKVWIDAIKHRVQFASQVLAGFQSAKMSGMIDYLTDRLQELRMIELKKSLTLRRFMVMSVSTSLGAPNLSPVLALAVYAVDLQQHGSTLNPIFAFTALAYITLITFPLLVVMQASRALIQALACLAQIDEFLRQQSSVCPRIMSTSETRTSEGANQEKKPSTHVIDIKNCTFTRTLDSQPVLKDISISFERGSFTQIIGPSASGKSTLVQAILGELICKHGTLDAPMDNDSIAYAPQTPWIRTGSVQDNIVLNSRMDSAWYREVTYACALDQDLDALHSSAGSSGSALSGGQRQKVSLARAVYSKRSILVIDEPFTGIDGTSSEQILRRLFSRDGLLRRHGITVITASHAGKHIGIADYVVELRPGGMIMQQGRPETLELEHYKQVERNPIVQNATKEVSAVSANPVAYILKAKEALSDSSSKDRRTGELAAYGYYFSALGWVKLMLTGMCVALFVFFQLFTQPWVTWWTESNLTDPNNRMGYWLGLYAAYGVLAIAFLAMACKFMLVDMVRASGSALHAVLCKTIARAPITLFASTDTGLTVNRFSQDMSLVDMELPLALSSLAIMFMLTLGQFGLILSASKYLAAVIPLVVVACVIIQRLYIKTSRQLRFHEIESKSPLYTHFIETIDGLASIRAYGLQDYVHAEMDIAIDECQRPYYLLLCAQRYLGLLLNLTVAGLVMILVGIAIAVRGKTDTSFYGQALVNVMTFGQSLTMVIDYWTQFEISLAAVQRTKEFGEETPQEVTNEPMVDPHLPFAEGKIKVSYLSAEYSNDMPVLTDINLTIQPGEKVAICGRSGSGKSTLCYAMLRMLEASGGTITIDGQDIAHIPHEDLRSAIGAVPQNPLILNDTLQINLDPLGESTDEAVMNTLRNLDMLEKFNDRDPLSVEISPDTLSMSERQLICLGRALLKDRAVLILDEAASSVDSVTDQKIQRIVCKSLPRTTVVSVMHRFDHIMLYDRIVLMAQGKIVEVGRPGDLLADPGSHFSELHAAESTAH